MQQIDTFSHQIFLAFIRCSKSLLAVAEEMFLCNIIHTNDYLIKAYDKVLIISGDVVVYGCKVFQDNSEYSDEYL